MEVTIAICTWNRAKLLDQTLAEMHQLVIPVGVDWELIVVNNNCTDDTDAVLARHADKLPLMRLLEIKQGHCYARNCAIAAARGELLIWTDDDVLVEPQWLAEYVKAAQAWPEASYFGGTIDPWFESDPPAWFVKNWHVVRQAFVVRQYGDEVRPLGEQEVPAGASMAFRTAELREFQFDTKLGRFADELSGGDDNDVINRMRAAGKVGIWVGMAKLRHFLPTERLSRRYLQRWFRGAGITQLRMRGMESSPMLFGMPRWALKQYVAARTKALALEPVRNSAWLAAFREAMILEGFLSESRRLATSH